MSVKRIETNDREQLAYRQGPSYVWPAIAAIVGIAFLHGTTWRLIVDWPQDAWPYGGGILLCLALIIWAVRKTARYDLVLDRKSGQALVTVRWPWRRTCKTLDIADAVEVQRHAVQPIETPDTHWVSLGKSDGAELRLFDEPRFDDLGADEADKIAQEIGDHLQLPVVHYVNGAKATDVEHRTAGHG